MLSLFSWFKGRNKNKEKMASLSESSLDELKSQFSPMEFQWIKGDFASSTEAFKDVSTDGENKFIIFMSGRRINVDLLDEFMLYFPAPPKQTQRANQPPQPRRENSSVTSIVYEDSPSQSLSDDSPIYKLLKKQKKNLIEVGIKLKLNLPSKELYTVLSTSFDDAEKEIINFVLDGVDIEDIKLALAESIKKNYYSQNTKTDKAQANSSQSQTKKTPDPEDEPAD